MLHTVEIDLDGQKITLETGKIAKQANGAVVVRSGDTVVLVSACANEEPKANAAFFPLTVDYREYTYAAGKFPGGFIKREGRPSEKEILTSRLIDRPIRPLFPEGFMNESQVIAMVLSADPQRDPSTLAIIGAGAALAISDIPFQHVLGGVRVGSVNGKLVANPSYDETRESKVNIVVAGTEGGIVMVEAGAQHASEDEVLEAIEYGHSCCKKIAAGIRELVAKVGKKKWDMTAPVVNKELYARIESQIRKELTDALDTKKYPKLESYHRVHEAKKKVVEALPEEEQVEAKELFDTLEGAHLPRRDAEGAPPSGWPGLRRDSEHRMRSGRAAPHARLGVVHPRRDAGSGYGYARHQGRRTAHRDVRPYRNLQALHVALQLPAVQRRRSWIHARSRAAAKWAMARWPSDRLPP